MKSCFTRLSFREQLLLLVFLISVASVWLSYATARSMQIIRGYKGMHSMALEQSVWLQNRERIERRGIWATRGLVASKTLDANQLFSEVSGLVQGLKFDIGDLHTEQSGGVSIHSIQLQMQKIDLIALGHFYSALQLRAPYVGLESCELTVDPAAVGMIDARMRIYSIEIPPAPRISPKA
jgi:hypothetical protein